MPRNRQLVKTDLRGFSSETTERNERLKIWLGLIGGTTIRKFVGTILVAIFHQ